MRKALFLSVLAVSLAWSADWLTSGGDSQRTHWQHDETALSPATAKNIKLLWKIHLDSQPRVMSNLHQPLVAGNVTTANGTNRLNGSELRSSG